MRNSDVLVIGAGVVGAAAARALAAAGRKVLVLSRGAGIGEASPAAAGMLAAQVESPTGPALAFACAARARHAALAAELAAAGLPVDHHADGIIHVAWDDSEAGALRATAQSHRDAGLRAEWLDQDQLRKEVPGIGGEPHGAVAYPDDGRVDNARLVKALMRDAIRRGARMEFAVADRLIVESGRLTGAAASAGIRSAPVVILAAGAWSARLAGLPRSIPVEPVRGQMLRLPWPAAMPQRTLFGSRAYLVPRGPDALVGSTMERAGFDPNTTADGIASLRAAAGAIAPDLASVPPLEAWAGLRPMTPDGMPIIGRDPDLEGLVYATGHGRNGILLGPLSGEIAADLALGAETRFDAGSYGIGRFA